MKVGERGFLGLFGGHKRAVVKMAMGRYGKDAGSDGACGKFTLTGAVGIAAGIEKSSVFNAKATQLPSLLQDCLT